MIALESSGHNAVYLDHNRLINEAYNANVNNSAVYNLKPILFSFQPKLPTTNDVSTPKKRKRKATSSSFTKETLDLKDASDALLTTLKQITNALPSKLTDGTIERTWEEPTMFPQLKGSNATSQFQNFTLDNKHYLIPPDCRFFNHDLLKLEEISNYLERFDFVVLDPPWRNKYIRRIKKAKPELGYKMMNNGLLSGIPLDEFIHSGSVVAVWCTNSKQHQQTLLGEFFPRWDLCLIQRIVWLKLNSEGSLIGEINEDGKKQPYEVLFLARHRECQKDFSELKKIEFLLSVPSIIHSHKPPVVELLRSELPQNPKCLELFARYLQPNFTSIGLEVLKLMDARLYSQVDSNS